jgi:hypothetical protein
MLLVKSHSIQLEREPYESEVRAELRWCEEERRIESKRQRKGTTEVDASVLERLQKLESCMKEREGEMRVLEDEVRKIKEDVYTCKKPVHVE